MTNRTRSVFQQSAVNSGLLTAEQVDTAHDELADQITRVSGQPITDEQLAEKFINEGFLNRWQAQQLRGGRTKFNLGPYQIVDSIGRGGMGEVYKAEHQIMGRTVAVKVLPRHRTSPETIASFLREIRAMAQLDHENLVRAFDAGEDGAVHFLVCEYVPGSDLRRLIRREGRLSVQQAASIISQSAKGLSHAHGRGLIHRDVKPGNILVTPEGKAKVSDLGLAGYFSDGEQEDVKGGKVVGTADYLAPEQITAPDKLCPQSDIYSLGCTLYYAVTGKVPFPGGTAREKARAHIQVPPWNPRRFNPELTEDFVEIIAEMMAKNIEKRTPSAADVVSRLAPWVEGRGSSSDLDVFGSQPVHDPWSTSLGDPSPGLGSDWPSGGSGGISLGGHTTSIFDEETLPALDGSFKTVLGGKGTPLPPIVRLLMLMAVATVVSAMLLIVIQMIFRF